MRAVVQRVSQASVTTDGQVVGSIRNGLLVYLGVERDDDGSDVAYIAEKIRGLRIFSDEAGRMNLDLEQTGGRLLIVSAFTVGADVRRGRRPSFETTATADEALALYELLCDTLDSAGMTIERGAFGKHMDVDCVNDGPVCILLDSSRLF